MKRPLFLAAVAVLSGAVCGILEISPIYKLAAACCECGTVYFLWKLSGGESHPLRQYRKYLIAAAAALFILGFFRALAVSVYYNTGERAEFYADHRSTNPGEFDYGMYLRSQGVATKEEYEIYKNRQTAVRNTAASAAETNSNEGLSAPAAQNATEEIAPTERLRSYLSSVFDKYLTEHDSGIYKAVLLGDRSEMDSRIRDLYQDAGIAHLLAVSGLHVSMLGMGLYRLLSRLGLGRKISPVICSVFVFFYACLTGASGSALRAAVMLVFSFAAMAMYRIYDMRSALCAALMLLLFLNPYLILTSGFQLSFGAVAGISFVGEGLLKGIGLMLENAGNTGPIKKHIRKRNRLHIFIKTFIISASIQLVTLPLTAYHFFTFPPYGILLNFCVIPLMSAVLLSGLAVLAFGVPSCIIPVLSPLLGRLSVLSAAPGHYVLKLYEILCSAVKLLPFNTVVIGTPNAIQILFYYSILFTAVYLWSGGRHLRPRHRLSVLITGFLAVIFAVVLSFTLKHREPSGLSVTALDVGQGDSFYIHKGRLDILIDGGSSGYDKIGENVIEPFLLSRGVDSLDMVIASHSDADHTNGLVYIMSDESKIDVQRLVLPMAARSETKPQLSGSAYSELLEAAIASGALVFYIDTGDKLAQSGSLSLDCLYGGFRTAGSDDSNRDSSAVLLRDGGFSMLFTGDMTSADEELMCSALEGAGLSFASGNTRATLPHISSGSGEQKDSLTPAKSSAPDRLTVLKAAHHGSKTSTCEKLLDTFKPMYAVISYGKYNNYGHPSPEVTERLEARGTAIHKTAELGAVTYRYKNRKLEIISQLPGD